MSAVRIGTSGWIYRHWRGLFYPDRLPQKAWLEHYARSFDTVELNFSFYRLPSRETFQAWHDRAAPGFCYAVKASRFITHLKRLREPADHVGLFFERLAGLGDRTGPILWQLPPNFQRDDGRLREFLAVLPRHYRHTIEFRHGSWLVDDVLQQLADHGVALCIPESPGLERSIRLTTNWTYLRFHYGLNGGDYTAEQLDFWADHIRGFHRQGADVWIYFNNDPHGHALKNAVELRNRLAPAEAGQSVPIASNAPRTELAPSTPDPMMLLPRGGTGSHGLAAGHDTG